MSGQFLPNRMQARWDDVRPFLKNEWPRLTDADLDEIAGCYDRLILRLRELYDLGDPISLEAQVKGKIQRHLNEI